MALLCGPPTLGEFLVVRALHIVQDVLIRPQQDFQSLLLLFTAWTIHQICGVSLSQGVALRAKHALTLQIFIER